MKPYTKPTRLSKPVSTTCRGSRAFGKSETSQSKPSIGSSEWTRVSASLFNFTYLDVPPMRQRSVSTARHRTICKAIVARHELLLFPWWFLSGCDRLLMVEQLRLSDLRLASKMDATLCRRLSGLIFHAASSNKLQSAFRRVLT